MAKRRRPGDSRKSKLSSRLLSTSSSRPSSTEDPWICAKCTYLHGTSAEAMFLSCKLCGSPRNSVGEPAPKRKRTRHASSSSRSVFDVLSTKSRTDFLEAPRYKGRGEKDFRYISREEMRRACPVALEKAALPAALAKRLLTELMAFNAEGMGIFKRGTWRVQGRLHTTPRTSCSFEIDWEGSVNDGGGGDDDGDATKAEYNGLNKGGSDQFGNGKVVATESMVEAARIAMQHVRAHSPRAGRHWRPTHALVNRYETSRENVGFHSDHLNSIGPRPIIAGLSLGASRRFDLKSQDDGSGLRAMLQLQLPHNSLCIMLEGCQEGWQHAVPSCSLPSPHPISGNVRYSLTFRMRRKDLPSLGWCRCRDERTAAANGGTLLGDLSFRAASIKFQAGRCLSSYLFALSLSLSLSLFSRLLPSLHKSKLTPRHIQTSAFATQPAN